MNQFMLAIGIGIGFLALPFVAGIRLVRPTCRGLVERFGRYKRMAQPGFNWIIPGIDRLTWHELLYAISSAR